MIDVLIAPVIATPMTKSTQPSGMTKSKFGQNPLKDAYPRVFTRMLWKDRRKEGRMVALL
jgi:hypothetical protein